ncbi:hypothetical protein JD844_001080 [Phrynosoma platyrhinos]|uniref:Ig-like domain-containing protein n=1 Tax=Phrynosoma platyrhinos TaxID=52577 RepID=A0ABQ7T922_PHRPL|nr:hypothetical protein JD844_001080 [Phrynosoma platyrhinos]
MNGQVQVEQSPPSKEIFERENATLTCSISVSSLQWYTQLPGQEPVFLMFVYGNQKNDKIKHFIGEYNSKEKQGYLHIVDAQLVHGANYFCAVEAHPSEISWICSSILGQNPFSVTQENKFASVKEGDPIQFHCSYEGTEYSLQWYRQYPGGHPLFILLLTTTRSISDGPFEMTLDTKKKTTTLYLKSTRLNDSATYFWARSQDNVHQEPMVVSKEGENAAITCQYKTSSFYSLQWYKQYPGRRPVFLLRLLSEKTENEGNAQANLDKKKQESLLSIREIHPRDAATYFCAGSEARIMCFRTMVVSKEGETATITCRYNVSNFYNLQWYKQYQGERVVLLLQLFQEKPESKDNFHADLDKTKRESNLSIMKVHLRDIATYFCAVVAQ